ncbi:hypothetical protein CPLU01_10143 [Colletotrichum plurivorum]|uniref:Uncharacterized protein n=1 Tax=Colletotrichum plurivorum TaxID=2175906 RepID=A0A8H6K670_9PEZI|nr:hypothetical protein CPLU01_10143 [Colletotrichum plurivorum]
MGVQDRMEGLWDDGKGKAHRCDAAEHRQPSDAVFGDGSLGGGDARRVEVLSDDGRERRKGAGLSTGVTTRM